MRKICACIFLLVAPLLAQRAVHEPPASATGPAFEASVGYVYLSMAMPSQRVALGGLDANGLVKFSTHWAVSADATYAHTSNVLGTGYNGNFLSFLAGPAFYPVVRPRLSVFVRAMAGAGWVDSAVPVSGANYLGGWVARPSLAAGGGFEHSLFGPFSIRAVGDWQRTTFANSTGALQVQNNLRLTTGFAYRFGNR
ncbi:MAG TPA: hypothetical protein VKR60_10690 [Candidatus Sulfotelmatobacter sp.]|nr:hypothetical protein [Candidatus Sulfotelmatobacter sp.]